MRARAATMVLALLLACGDDDNDAADGGKDAGAESNSRHDATKAAGRGGSSGSGGRSGGGAGAGAGGESGAGGAAGTSDAGSGGAPDADSGDMQRVTIRFQGKFGAKKLACGDEYALPGLAGAAVTPTDFRFFVQEVRLISESGKEEPVIFDDRAPAQTRDVALIDLTDDLGRCGSGTTEPNAMITGKVAAGKYTGIAFVNGVPESVNHQDLLAGKAPLDDASTYWGWNNGYRFIMSGLAVVPGEADDADGGVAPLAGNSVVHVGAAGCSGAPQTGFKCSRPNRNHVALKAFNADSNVIVADLEKVFGGLDLSKPLECHGPSSPACGTAYAALGLDASDGSARDMQTVFRAE